ncbi:hypothetical protein bcere0016_15710 [Bacillus cereus 95/8201]|nr:hypothetical protein bcere0016_15710 [Bacillus cereus 95/8201]
MDIIIKEAKNIGVYGYEKEENNEVYDRNYNGLRRLYRVFTM